MREKGVLLPALLLALTSGTTADLGGQTPESPAPQPPLDTASLAAGPHATLSTLYERTIFRVDVVRVRVRFGPETAGRLRELVGGRDRTEALADSAARVAIRSRDAFAQVRFERDVSLEDYLEATRENMERTREAGILTAEEVASVSRGMPEWYAPLRDRGMKEGDRLLYRIRGDTLRTVFLRREGEVAFDLVHRGPERRLAVLGGFLAPEADFRDGLLDALFEAGPGGP